MDYFLSNVYLLLPELLDEIRHIPEDCNCFVLSQKDGFSFVLRKDQLEQIYAALPPHITSLNLGYSLVPDQFYNLKLDQAVAQIPEHIREITFNERTIHLRDIYELRKAGKKLPFVAKLRIVTHAAQPQVNLNQIYTLRAHMGGSLQTYNQAYEAALEPEIGKDPPSIVIEKLMGVSSKELSSCKAVNQAYQSYFFRLKYLHYLLEYSLALLHLGLWCLGPLGISVWIISGYFFLKTFFLTIDKMCFSEEFFIDLLAYTAIIFTMTAVAYLFPSILLTSTSNLLRWITHSSLPLSIECTTMGVVGNLLVRYGLFKLKSVKIPNQFDQFTMDEQPVNPGSSEPTTILVL